MRQLLAAAALVAVVGFPAAWFLGAFQPAAPTVAPAATEPVKDSADAVIDRMREIATGLGQSLEHGEGSAGTIVLASDAGTSVVAARTEVALSAGDHRSRGLTALGSKVEAGARTTAASPARTDDVVDVAIDAPEPSAGDAAAIAATPSLNAPAFRYPRFAAAGGGLGQGGTLISRDYPTSFFWFDLV